ncbi:MAG: hypothetical protein DRQ10_00885 [Candidatus Hydrothermota bacterium]|nr:MAG: hypothetical protein DRQ10_00885 [Candidatus Hydrothermae bacterium]
MKAAVGVSTIKDTVRATEEALWQAIPKLRNLSPSLIITFPTYDRDYRLVQHTLTRILPKTPVLGASSVSTFTHENFFEDSAVVVMLLAAEEDVELQIVTGIGEGINDAPISAVMKTLLKIKDKRLPRYSRYYQRRLMLTFIDGLAATKDIVIEELILATQMDYDIAGGAAAKPIGTDQKPTFVFTEDGFTNDGIAAAEVLANVPIGIGVKHGWWPLDDTLHRITKISNNILLEIDERPAADFFIEIGEKLGLPKVLDWRDLADLLWKLEIGIPLPNGEYAIRSSLVPLDGGRIRLTTALPRGTLFKVMVTNSESMIKAAQEAVGEALDALGDVKPAAALIFECLGRKTLMGSDFFKELEIITNLIRDVPMLGFHSYGELAWAERKLSGFHNMTIVVVLFGERRIL